MAGCEASPSKFASYAAEPYYFSPGCYVTQLCGSVLPEWKWLSERISERHSDRKCKAVQGIDKELLSSCDKDYKGELAFFAISEKCRGKGLGRKLFQTVVEYMKTKNISEFYLFTDTSCNYLFYEHLGLTRCCEKKQAIDVKGEKGDMTFFIYEYQIENGQKMY